MNKVQQQMITQGNLGPLIVEEGQLLTEIDIAGTRLGKDSFDPLE